jgi:hypothetical protein
VTIKHHFNLVQGSTEWLDVRCGLLTASEMKLIVTPTLKAASNEKERAHLYTLLAQRVAGYTEDAYQNDDMLRGHEDEIDAKILYQTNYAEIEDCGFITNDEFGFTIGYSPDGMIGAEGLIEIKSRKHKFQVETILDNVAAGTIPTDFLVQVQTGLLVSGRKWCDFISYSAGLPMATVRVFPDPVVQEAIIEAATAFEVRLAQRMAEFGQIMNSGARLLATERRREMEIRL